MQSIKKLLEIRKLIKSKKPDFIRHDANKKKNLARKWRKPKGLHSKMRLNRRGKPKAVSSGYRSPRKVRYLDKSGLRQFLVRSAIDLEKLNSAENCLIISSSLGDKKRVDILKKAKEMKFIVLNFKNPDDYIKRIDEKMGLGKNALKDKMEGKKEAIAEKKEKLVEKAEDRKNIEKMEKDKFLTKRV